MAVYEYIIGTNWTPGSREMPTPSGTIYTDKKVADAHLALLKVERDAYYHMMFRRERLFWEPVE